jgi:hypothetical protein
MRRKEAASSAMLGAGGGEAEGYIHSKRDERGGPLGRPRDACMHGRELRPDETGTPRVETGCGKSVLFLEARGRCCGCNDS